MKILESERDSIADIERALTTGAHGPIEDLERTVRGIISDVRSRGDAAVMELGRRFDSPNLSSLEVTAAEFDEAYAAVRPELLTAIRAAKANIEEFHRRQLRESWVHTGDGFTYGQLIQPIEKVGFYAPGGLAPYPSTVLMAAVPGLVAGVKTLTMAAPARIDGRVHEAMLVAARECGVSKVYKMGGAQAVAALAFGTKTVEKVDKIVGPGNAYVAEAKRQVFGIVGIDSIAGPSEILVIADDSANPAYVAADILSQAEHSFDSRCALVTDSRKLADAVIAEITRQTATAARESYIVDSLKANGVIVIARDIEECARLANLFAPEHLEICCREPWEMVGKIRNAGTIMVGHYTPVPLCDFAAGPNHTLPTAGAARFSSPLSVDDYVKKSGLLWYSRDALRQIAPTVLELARAEGFDAHANSVRIRL